MNTRLSRLFAMMITLMVFSGCIHFRVTAPSVSNASEARNDQVTRDSLTPVENNSVPDRKPLAIGSVAAYGFWWSEAQLENNFDADNPPPKNAYVKLDRWDASQPDSAHPNRIDIICRLENNTKSPTSVSLEAFATFKVAPYRQVARGAATEEAVDEKLAQTSWSANQKIGRLDSVRVLPNASREVTFKDFPLRAVIAKYLKPTAGDLWPWRLKISIIAKNSRGGIVAHADTIIGLTPAD